jgi:hypothetical protein
MTPGAGWRWLCQCWKRQPRVFEMHWHSQCRAGREAAKRIRAKKQTVWCEDESP